MLLRIWERKRDLRSLGIDILTRHTGACQQQFSTYLSIPQRCRELPIVSIGRSERIEMGSKAHMKGSFLVIVSVGNEEFSIHQHLPDCDKIAIFNRFEKCVVFRNHAISLYVHSPSGQHHLALEIQYFIGQKVRYLVSSIHFVYLSTFRHSLTLVVRELSNKICDPGGRNLFLRL